MKSKRIILLLLSAFYAMMLWSADFYVKSTGKGNGTSWTDAMSPEKFSAQLATAEDGDVFHLAAGFYEPVVQDETESTAACFKISSSVKLIGGYSENPADGEISDPSNNETIFRGINSKNDEISYETSEDNLTYPAGTGLDDNSECIFEITTAGKSVSFYGISMTRTKGNYSKGAIIASSSVSLEVKECSFYELGGSAIYSAKACSVTIENSRFEKCAFDYRCAVFLPVSTTVKIDHCAFTENGSHKNYGESGSTGGAVSIKNGNISNTSFYKNSAKVGASIYMYSPGENTIENCTFIDNVSYDGTIFLLLGSGQIKIFNSTFVNNTQEDELAATIDKSESDELNLVGNIFVGRSVYHRSNILEENKMKTSYNVFTELPFYKEGNLSASETDHLVLLSDISNILKGSYSSGLFVPSVESAESALIVPLKSDRISIDKTIRFPGSVTSIVADARGVERCDMTCAGSYELRDCDEPMDLTRSEYYEKTVAVSWYMHSDPKSDEEGFTASVKMEVTEPVSFYVFDAQGCFVVKSSPSVIDGVAEEFIKVPSLGVYAVKLVTEKTRNVFVGKIFVK